MQQKIGDWTEEQFETKVKKIVTEVVKEEVRKEVRKEVKHALETITPPWVERMQKSLDIAAGNYKDIHEEQTLLAGKQSEHSDELEALDTRVTKIEDHLRIN